MENNKASALCSYDCPSEATVRLPFSGGRSPILSDQPRSPARPNLYTECRAQLFPRMAATVTVSRLAFSAPFAPDVFFASCL